MIITEGCGTRSWLWRHRSRVENAIDVENMSETSVKLSNEEFWAVHRLEQFFISRGGAALRLKCCNVGKLFFSIVLHTSRKRSASRVYMTREKRGCVPYALHTLHACLSKSTSFFVCCFICLVDRVPCRLQSAIFHYWSDITTRFVFSVTVSFYVKFCHKLNFQDCIFHGERKKRRYCVLVFVALLSRPIAERDT